MPLLFLFIQDPDVHGSLCNPLKPSNCIRGTSLPIGSGVMTGNCIPSSVDTSLNVCEIYAWCPVERDILPLYKISQLSNLYNLIINFYNLEETTARS